MYKSKLMRSIAMIAAKTHTHMYDNILAALKESDATNTTVVDEFLGDIVTFLLNHENPKMETMALFDFKKASDFCYKLCLEQNAPIRRFADGYKNRVAAIIHSSIRIINRQTHNQASLTGFVKLMKDLGITQAGSWNLDNNVQSFSDTAFLPGDEKTAPTIELNL